MRNLTDEDVEAIVEGICSRAIRHPVSGEVTTLLRLWVGTAYEAYVGAGHPSLDLPGPIR